MSNAMHPTASARITWNGVVCELRADRTLVCVAARALVVADAHFGKDSHFRARGVPVPAGTTPDDLARLTAAVRETQVEHVIFLGDFLHGAGSRDASTFEALDAWRAHHPQLALTLVIGNHDRRAGFPAHELGFALVEEPWSFGGLELCHHPPHEARRPTLAGHVHPGVRLHSAVGRARVRPLRVPCFFVRERLLLLPAFGGFTGQFDVTPRAGDAVYAVGTSIVRVHPSHVDD